MNGPSSMPHVIPDSRQTIFRLLPRAGKPSSEEPGRNVWVYEQYKVKVNRLGSFLSQELSFEQVLLISGAFFPLSFSSKHSMVSLFSPQKCLK